MKEYYKRKLSDGDWSIRGYRDGFWWNERG